MRIRCRREAAAVLTQTTDPQLTPNCCCVLACCATGCSFLHCMASTCPCCCCCCMRAGVGLLLLPVVLHLKQVSLTLLHKVPVLINRHPLADLQTAAAPLLLLVRVSILHGVPVLALRTSVCVICPCTVQTQDTAAVLLLVSFCSQHSQGFVRPLSTG